jgi:hypothetical protein
MQRAAGVSIVLCLVGTLSDVPLALAGGPSVDIESAKAQCKKSGFDEEYSVEFVNYRFNVTIAGTTEGKDVSVTRPISAVIQLGQTAIVVTEPNPETGTVYAFFFGATTKAAFYIKGGPLEHEDKCELVSIETAIAIDAPQGGVK